MADVPHEPIDDEEAEMNTWLTADFSTVYEEQLETKFSRETKNVFTLSLAQLLL